MKQAKRLPVPQKEFGFTQETFNLFQESAVDGERIAKEQEQSASARRLAEQAQRRLFKKRI